MLKKNLFMRVFDGCFYEDFVELIKIKHFFIHCYASIMFKKTVFVSIKGCLW